MPDRAIQKIMAATDTADVAQLAMIEAMRQLGDNGKATNRILEGMQVELKDVRERVIRIEASETKEAVIKVDARVDELDDRVTVLEAAELRRDGALRLTNWTLRNWPAIIGYIVLAAIVLFANGRLQL